MRIITCLSVAIILIASVVINSTVVARADQQGKGKEPAKSAPAQNSKEEDKQSSEQVEKITTFNVTLPIIVTGMKSFARSGEVAFGNAALIVFAMVPTKIV